VSIRVVPFILCSLAFLSLSSAQDTTRLPPPKNVIPSQYDSSQAVERLQRQLDALFSSKAYRRSEVTAKVVSITRGTTLYERNPEKALTPASVTKLFTTNAGFYALGTEGAMTTEVRATGKIAPDGTLHGDLYIVGAGDAMLDVNDIEEMADNLFGIGLRRVDGTIYGDPSFFDEETNRAVYSGDGEDVVRLPPIEALTYSEGEIKVVVSASSKGYVNVQTIPASDAFILRASTRKGARASRIRITSSVRADGRQEITVSGSPGANRTKTYTIQMRSPSLAAAGTLSDRLRSGGIENDTAIGVAKAPSTSRVLTSHKNRFVELASRVNKRSDNYLAEHVFKMVGALYGGQENTADIARKMVLATLDSLKVPRNGATFNDGSGLSRRNVVSAATAVAMLRQISKRSYAKEFYTSLAIAGVDGTIRGRMLNTPADSNVHAKTGTLRDASGLAGYVRTRDGELLAFAFISNGPYKTTFKRTEDRAAINLASFSYRDGGMSDTGGDEDLTEEEEVTKPVKKKTSKKTTKKSSKKSSRKKKR